MSSIATVSPTTVTTCHALIQQGPRKGQPCGNHASGTYCAKHTRQAVHDKAEADNIRYCDIARGCYVVLEDHQAKCTNCLRKAQILDRKRHGKKRADESLCLDCGQTLTSDTQAKGKHDRLLRRCSPCYEKLQHVEQSRKPRERNYKAEAFTNKHVVWNHYVKGAKKRGLSFELTKTHFVSLLTEPCFYCAYQKQGEVNGIDRVNNNKGYHKDNVVPCCQVCNEAKGAQHPQEFVDKLHAIHLYRTSGMPIPSEKVEEWKETYLSRTVTTYRTYTKNANTRTISFALTEEEFTQLVQQPCYLCGLPRSDQNHNGIDRVQNTEGYLLSNSKPCCGHCNLLKKQATLQDIYRVAEQVFGRYAELTAFLADKEIPRRASKVAGREKNTESLVTAEPVPIEYKSAEEILPSPPPPPKEIIELLEVTSEPPAPVAIKQWKSSTIYRAIQQHQENEYKAFCEQNNDMTLLPTWETDWVTFVLSVKGRSEADALPLITAFVENLRRIRHNKLCYDKNASLVEKEDRQQWPATTVVRAFLEGKMKAFKGFTEASTGENPEDPKWVKRWTGFMDSLEAHREDPEQMKTLCSKFMTAQRTKKYRAKANE